MLMIPGRNLCDDGWQTEYTGNLAAEQYDHYRVDFVCLDDKPEPSQDSSPDNNNGVLVFVAQAKCGALKCPPYENEKDLVCAVCTR